MSTPTKAKQSNKSTGGPSPNPNPALASDEAFPDRVLTDKASDDSSPGRMSTGGYSPSAELSPGGGSPALDSGDSAVAMSEAKSGHATADASKFALPEPTNTKEFGGRTIGSAVAFSEATSGHATADADSKFALPEPTNTKELGGRTIGSDPDGSNSGGSAVAFSEATNGHATADAASKFALPEPTNTKELGGDPDGSAVALSEATSGHATADAASKVALPKPTNTKELGGEPDGSAVALSEATNSVATEWTIAENMEISDKGSTGSGGSESDSDSDSYVSNIDDLDSDDYEESDYDAKYPDQPDDDFDDYMDDFYGSVATLCKKLGLSWQRSMLFDQSTEVHRRLSYREEHKFIRADLPCALRVKIRELDSSVRDPGTRTVWMMKVSNATELEARCVYAPRVLRRFQFAPSAFKRDGQPRLNIHIMPTISLTDARRVYNLLRSSQPCHGVSLSVLNPKQLECKLHDYDKASHLQRLLHNLIEAVRRFSEKAFPLGLSEAKRAYVQAKVAYFDALENKTLDVHIRRAAARQAGVFLASIFKIANVLRQIVAELNSLFCQLCKQGLKLISAMGSLTFMGCGLPEAVRGAPRVLDICYEAALEGPVSAPPEAHQEADSEARHQEDAHAPQA